MSDITTTPSTDSSAALAAIGPEFDDSVPEGVDAASLPEMRDMRRMLPSKRFEVKAKVGKIATSLPKNLENLEGDIDLQDLGPETWEKFQTLFSTMEEIVLDTAADRDAMEQWLINQESGESAIQFAFGRVSETLGN